MAKSAHFAGRGFWVSASRILVLPSMSERMRRAMMWASRVLTSARFSLVLIAKWNSTGGPASGFIELSADRAGRSWSPEL